MRKILIALLFMVLSFPFLPSCKKTDVLYLSIVWHMHQPFYFKEGNVYAKPWVRVHASKDYFDMVNMLKDYPDIKASFNLTPTLIKQLEDFSLGATDKYEELARKSVANLGEDDKKFILRRFFDANWDNVVATYPRYLELLNKRGRNADDETINNALKRYSDQDYLDLTTLFHLAWTDPDFLKDSPLKEIKEKERNFSEEERKIVLDKIREITSLTLSEYKKFQDSGQVEITVTPFAHPILPLIYDTNSAKIATPELELPKRYSYPEDAIKQVELGIEYYEKLFGKKPMGMWPAEGSVSRDILKMIKDKGIKWIASDEFVLASSLMKERFDRDSQDNVKEPELLYKPYNALTLKGDESVSIVFRDHTVSDLIGFAYSGMDGEKASDDFLRRVRAIRDKLKEKKEPHLVTVILDGENAWEWYRNDGKDFLNSLYRKLSKEKDIVTIQPGEFIKKFPPKDDIPSLWAGSWIDGTFKTWIGEEEENKGWQYLLTTREDIEKKKNFLTETQKSEVFDLLYKAEGSDWFWWYGSDQDSGDDASFDEMFRKLLIKIYEVMGEKPRDYLYIPIVSKPIPPPEKEITATISPLIDGRLVENEWQNGGEYIIKEKPLNRLLYGMDRDNLYIGMDIKPEVKEGVLEIAVLNNRFPQKNVYTFYSEKAVGFGISQQIIYDLKSSELKWVNAKGDGKWEEVSFPGKAVLFKNSLEISIPLGSLGTLESNDTLLFTTVFDKKYNIPEGPVKVIVPELEEAELVLLVQDPINDDYGGGIYVYPDNPVFKKGVFDLKEFSVKLSTQYLIFTFSINGPLENQWNSPIGLSSQTLDIYIDVDKKENSGLTQLLPGRYAVVDKKEAWDYAIWVEGWTQGVYAAGEDGKPKKLEIPLKVVVDGGRKTVVIKIPRNSIPGDPRTFGYLGILLSQEGFPPPNNWRVRDVLAETKQWKFGGGYDGITDTNIIDLAWDKKQPIQESILSAYKKTEETDLYKIPDDFFARIPMIYP